MILWFTVMPYEYDNDDTSCIFLVLRFATTILWYGSFGPLVIYFINCMILYHGQGERFFWSLFPVFLCGRCVCGLRILPSLFLSFWFDILPCWPCFVWYVQSKLCARSFVCVCCFLNKFSNPCCSKLKYFHTFFKTKIMD